MEIGKQIKKYRGEFNLSQEDLALKVYVSRQTISNWETDKNYPDMKSLLLLSSLFNVTLDTLIKGDIVEMKERININDKSTFSKDANIFTVFLIATMVLPIPLFYYLGNLGIIIWVLIFVVSFYYASRIEKQKKQLDIQTYKEIVAFNEGKSLNLLEKNQEIGKRKYQKALYAFCAALITGLISIIMLYIFK